MKNILVINPGSTSTKVAIYKSNSAGKADEIFSETITHSAKDLDKFETTASQEAFRAKAVTDFLSKNNITELDCCAGRGATVKSLSAGSYRINENMLKELRTEKYSNHASNLGALIAHTYVDWIAPVKIFAGEHELNALAEAGSRYIFGTESLKEY